MADRCVAPLALASVIALAACGGVDEPAPPPRVYAAYVLLSAAPGNGAPRAQARVIVEGNAEGCPQLTGLAEPLPMTFRKNPHGFPVKVCEALVPFGEALTVSWSGDRLPAARRDPERLAVFGDTGCKASDCDGEATPFAGLAAAAAALDPPPDLVLHAGDFNYRGTGFFSYGPDKLPVYDAGDVAPDDPRCQLDGPYVSQNAGYSERPDRWQDWWLDLFEPARSLLAAAPWVVTRGNHELCSRAGPGWFYFLDPSAGEGAGGTGQLACPPQGGEAPPTGAHPHLVFRDPFTVGLGTLRLAVLDSANACDGHAPAESTGVYAEQLGRLLEETPEGATTWLLTHRPVWGVERSKDEGPEALSRTLQAAVARTAAGSLPATWRLLVGGHMHQFLSLGFTGDEGARRPPQLVVGNSGVALYDPEPGAFTATIDGHPAEALSIARHGFLDVRLAPDGSWSATLVDPTSPTPLAICASEHPGGAVCRGEGDPPAGSNAD